MRFLIGSLMALAAIALLLWPAFVRADDIPPKELVQARAEANVIVAKATLSLKGSRSVKSAPCECESCRCIDCVCQSQQQFANVRAMKFVEDAKGNLKATIPAPPAILPLPQKTSEPPLVNRTFVDVAGNRWYVWPDGSNRATPPAKYSAVPNSSACVNGQCPNVR